MKKIYSIVLFAFLCLSASACSVTDTSETITTSTTPTSSETTTTLSQLNTPTVFSVIDNIISFSTVENATKYKVKVETLESVLVGEYFVSNGFDLFLILSTGSYYMSIKSTAPGYLDSEYSNPTQFNIADPNQINTLSAESLNDVNYVRWIGRTWYDETNARRYFFFAASGFEIAFYGTELTVDFFSTNSTVTYSQPYIVALVDGVEDPNEGTTFILNQADKTVTLVSGLEYGYHTVKLLKRSEASDSDTAVKSISTDGYFAQAPLAKDFKIQFIAASSSTGYGNLGSLSEAKTTANSDGLRAFAYLTSYLLDSEISIFSASGWGATRGWNTGGAVSATQTIPKAFEYTAINSSNTVFTASGIWDPSDYVPDVIVVNLGTNDFNANGYSSLTIELKKIQEDLFIDTYTNFLRTLNNMYPDAVIIVAYGLMGETGVLGGFTLQVVQNANDLIGSTVVHPFIMEAAGTNGNPYGSNSHPNVQTSMNVAEDLAHLISSLTGKEVVRDMITNE